MQKRGPFAWENARAEHEERGTFRPLRLIVHHVNDATNDEYVKEVRCFLARVAERRLPFTTDAEKDMTMGGELER